MNLVSHPEIHKQLLKRWNELDLSSSQIIEDAKERGMTITPASISKYKNAIKRDKKGVIKSTNFKGTLTLIQLLWLSYRYGINININIGTLKIEDGKPVFVVEKFDELKALKKLKEVFPDAKIELKDGQ